VLLPDPHIPPPLPSPPRQVSTKSGLDPGGVWHAWGMASLKAGQLTAARERFARVLKAPLDRNQLNQGPMLLQEIVQQLENTLRPSPSTVGWTTVVVYHGRMDYRGGLPRAI